MQKRDKNTKAQYLLLQA